eukprot:366462-Chlamydomonas_euryale.AAC.10
MCGRKFGHGGVCVCGWAGGWCGLKERNDMCGRLYEQLHSVADGWMSTTRQCMHACMHASLFVCLLARNVSHSALCVYCSKLGADRALLTFEASARFNGLPEPSGCRRLAIRVAVPAAAAPVAVVPSVASTAAAAAAAAAACTP